MPQSVQRRHFMFSAAAAFGATALAACNRTAEKSAPASTAGRSASVERIDAGHVRIRLEGFGADVRVLAADSPDAAGAALKPLPTRSAEGALDVAAPAMPRRYFVIEDGQGAKVRVAERLLPLEGGRNFRDLGGYSGHGGKTIAWGRLYRSGVMNELTAADRAYLASLGIATICDLRSAEELKSEPSAMTAADGADIITFDYDMRQTMASLGALMTAKTREEAVTAFAAGYVGMTDFLAPHYTDLFARLVREEVPLAVNCSAGKDRTGIAAALILSVLGTPRDEVIADYALSETYVPPEKYLEAMRNPERGETSSSISPQMAQVFAAMPEPVLRVLMGTDADVMRQALATFDAQFGGPVELAKARYGLTDAGIATMREAYLA
jgi:protein-tyrosine phosphatase